MPLKTCFLLISLTAGLTTAGLGQSISLSGKVVDLKDSLPLTGANVSIEADSSFRRGAITDIDGNFRMEKLPPGRYLIVVTFVGYKPLQRNIRLEEPATDIGVLGLEENTEVLKEIEVAGVRTRVEQNGDTTQYHADAYQTNPDANAEDLIRKMPGVVVENGKVQAQGEEVKRVLVDGNEFFADDPTLALRNLPAEVIDKVQVYDEMSDQAKFTGFEDGNTSKTINIITKPGKRNGQFGKLYAGYGTDDRYLAGGNVNYFNGAQRISVIGLSNNINQQNFSTQDLLGVVGSNSQRRGRPGGGAGGGGGRRGGGGGSRGGGGSGDISDFMVGQQDGITGANAFGLNYADQWGSKLKVNGSYFFSGIDNTSHTLLSRRYVTETGPGPLYEEEDQSVSQNLNHRFNFRLEYTLDEANSLVINPKLNLQGYRGFSDNTGTNTLEGSRLLSQTRNEYQTNYTGYNFSNNILFRHRFATRGRTFSANIKTAFNNKNGESSLYSLNEYFQSGDSTQLLDQASDLKSNGYTLSGELAYTEPLGKKGMLMFNYNPSLTLSASDKQTFQVDEESEPPVRLLDTTLTNVYDNRYITQSTGAGYMLRGKQSHLMVRLNYQHALLSGTQDFPYALDTDRSFNSLLPMAMFRYNFSSGSNLRLSYRTATDPPSVNQLQSVIDNSNPLLLTTGNPNLGQEYSHRLVARYGAANAEKSHSFFAFLMGSYTNDYIGNATLIASRDTLLAEGITLFQGSQLTRPVNLDGYWNVRSFLTYGLPVAVLKSNLNLNAGLSFTRTPGLINEALNMASTYQANTGFVLSSNISEAVDFTVAYAANYNIVNNSLVPNMDNNYFYQTTSAKFNWLFGKGFVFSTDLNHTLYTGLTDTFDQHYVLWNASFGYKFLKNKVAELKITAFDLLNQNNSISRQVTETYIEDNVTEVLKRYFMLTFTYNVRNFVVKDKQENTPSTQH